MQVKEGCVGLRRLDQLVALADAGLFIFNRDFLLFAGQVFNQPAYNVVGEKVFVHGNCSGCLDMHGLILAHQIYHALHAALARSALAFKDKLTPCFCVGADLEACRRCKKTSSLH